MTTSTVPILASEADMPAIDINLSDEERHEQTTALARDHWIARNAFGHPILRYPDVVAILRDKRWHSAASMIPEMMGITDPDFLEGRRESILSAEGDVHTRLRRLVAKSFSPRAADRLRPFMREVINGLVDTVSSTGRADVATNICEPYPIPIICELLGAPKKDWQLFSRWANARTANPVVAALANALAFAWFIALTFPLIA